MCVRWTWVSVQNEIMWLWKARKERRRRERGRKERGKWLWNERRRRRVVKASAGLFMALTAGLCGCRLLPAASEAVTGGITYVCLR